MSAPQTLLAGETFYRIFTLKLACKKVVSDSPRLVDFAIRLVKSVLNLPA